MEMPQQLRSVSRLVLGPSVFHEPDPKSSQLMELFCFPSVDIMNFMDFDTNLSRYSQDTNVSPSNPRNTVPYISKHLLEKWWLSGQSNGGEP